MDYKNPNKIINKYSCSLCSYFTNYNKDFNKHKNTKKHILNTNKHTLNTSIHIIINEKITMDYHICPCGKQYKYRQGLYKHKKICNFKEINQEICQEIDDKQDNIIINNNLEDLVIKLITENNEIKNTIIKENNEIKNTLLKENQELRQQITELIPKVGNNNIINSNNNQKFNINVFLNEQCKDAMSINEFVKSIEVSLKNLLTTKSKGLGFGINDIINENMNKLSIYERPIHCTDKKRETLYVKHDNWEKDTDKTHTTNMLKGLQLQQIKSLHLWKEAHPNYMQNEELKHEYMILVNKCTKPLSESEKKLFKNLCDNTYIKDEELLIK